MNYALERKVLALLSPSGKEKLGQVHILQAHHSIVSCQQSPETVTGTAKSVTQQEAGIISITKIWEPWCTLSFQTQ